MFPGKTHRALVISPLNALMQDQVVKWNRHSISSVAIHAEGGSNLKKVNLRNYSMAFISPEQALSKAFRKHETATYKQELCVIAFDEAHVITEWGLSNFRRDYAETHELLARLPGIPVLVMSGTMTDNMVHKTMHLLNIPNYVTVASNPDRPEIYLDVRQHTPDCLTWLATELLQNGTGTAKTIIYCQSFTQVSAVFEILLQHLGKAIHVPYGVRDGENRLVEMFSSAVDSSTKARVLRLFMKASKLRVVVGTIAFGLGVDIPEVRRVIFWGFPDSFCHLWQELGRCSRDGVQGEAIIYARTIPSCAKIPDELRAAVTPSGNKCVRRAILQQIWLSEMGLLPANGAKCGKLCTSCNCEFCKCCVYCRSVCPCVQLHDK